VCTQPYEISPRIIREATSLAKKYDVNVIEFSNTSPFIESCELIKGVKVAKIRIRLPPNKFIKIIIFLFKMLPRLLREKADVYHCFGLSSLVVGVLTKLLIRKKLIYDCFEHYPYQFAEPDLPRTFRRAVKWAVISRFEELLAKVCDHVIVVPSYKDELERRFISTGIKSVSTLANYPSISMFSNGLCDSSRVRYIRAEKVILYAGGRSRYLDLLVILKSMHLLVTEYKPNIKFKLLLVRPEPEWEKILTYVKVLKLEDVVKLVKPVPYFDISTIYRAGDIALVLYQPSYWTLRTKASERLFESMLFGLPLIVSDFPGLREIVTSYNCGILVNPTDPTAVAKAILYFFENPEVAMQLGENGRRAVLEELNWEKEEKKLERIYSQLFEKGARQPLRAR